MPTRRKVALLIETSNAYARGLLRGIRGWLRENRDPWAIRLFEHSRGAATPPWLRAWQGDGIIARVENPQIARALRATSLPVVDVSAALPRPDFPRVATDHAAVVRLAVEHLLELGLQHLAYCGDPRFHWSADRARHFTSELRRRKLTAHLYQPEKTLPPTADETPALIHWLRQLPRPVGILACYDHRGQQLLNACREASLAVPDDIAVIGVHNDEVLCDLCDPPLTSVIPDAPRAGYEAAALLSRLMSGIQLKPTQRHIEPLGIARRQSTDLVAIPDLRLSRAIRHIRSHATTGLDVKSLLRAVPMSRTLLERGLKQHLGLTPHQLILRTRLDAVKKLLATTALSIAEIAERTGYEHPEYMTVALRRETNLTPRAYRARHHSSA